MTNAATVNAITGNSATAGNAAAGNVADPSALADAAAAAGQAEWHGSFCSRYAHLLFEYGHWFLLVALIVGTIGALAAIVKMFTSKGDEETGGNILSTSVAALTALIDSLAKAPTWIAMLGAALALLWMSGHALPTFCQGAEDVTASNEAGSENVSPPSNESSANEAAGDESGG